ncbi:SDR family NAD(P)-dependent oxidoreductase [Pedobacter sp. BG31]
MLAQNKIAVFTGGSRGIGKNMVLNLTKNGLDIVFSYNNQKEAAEEVVK